MTSFGSKLPPVDGELIYVSADQHVDESSGLSFFSVHVKFINMDALKDVELHPGMPAALQIQTGSRTFFEYITDPILKVVRSSFKES